MVELVLSLLGFSVIMVARWMTRGRHDWLGQLIDSVWMPCMTLSGVQALYAGNVLALTTAVVSAAVGVGVILVFTLVRRIPRRRQATAVATALLVVVASNVWALSLDRDAVKPARTEAQLRRGGAGNELWPDNTDADIAPVPSPGVPPGEGVIDFPSDTLDRLLPAPADLTAVADDSGGAASASPVPQQQRTSEPGGFECAASGSGGAPTHEPGRRLVRDRSRLLLLKPNTLVFVFAYQAQTPADAVGLSRHLRERYTGDCGFEVRPPNPLPAMADLPPINDVVRLRRVPADHSSRPTAFEWFRYCNIIFNVVVITPSIDRLAVAEDVLSLIHTKLAGQPLRCVAMAGSHVSEI